MIQVSLDTSFLISFADPDRPNHAVAVDYFRHCLAQQIPMWIAADRRLHSRPAGTTGPR
jgi:predicted nucleic acid-binding protein